MTREFILGTAGHIDHGKTSLVKALTGKDCDRLPEEKARGITIDIGFAHLELPGLRIGIVDVPGHERFIRNMLAGATGIDIALLIIAADDSIMPQTREHFEILKLLGIRHGVIALTKADQVDPTTLEVVELEVRELVLGSFLEESAIIATSAHTGQGLEELKQAIGQECGKAQKARDRGYFRMGIDRAFVVQGHGAVVTGSVTGGSLKVGDEIEWLPKGEKVRVRALHHHDKAVDEVRMGMRAAINLAGVKHEELARGQELCTPGYLLGSRLLTVRLQALVGITKPIKHRLNARIHLGTSEVMGTISILDADRIEPGQSALAQILLEEPVMASRGQPFVLRDAQAAHTLGGGCVLQSMAKRIRRRHLELLVQVERLESKDPLVRTSTALWFAGLEGTDPQSLARDGDLAREEIEPTIQALKASGELVETTTGTTRKLLPAGPILAIEEKILATLGRLHDQFPLMSTHERGHVEAQLSWLKSDDLVRRVVDSMIERKSLSGNRKRIGRADFKPKLSNSLRKLKDKLVEAYRVARFQPPDPSSFIALAGGHAASLADLYSVCEMEDDLVKVGEGVWLHVESAELMRKRVSETLSGRAIRGETGMTVAEIRDLLGTTRKFAVPICEHLDAIHLTRRQGDTRVLFTDTIDPAKGR